MKIMLMSELNVIRTLTTPLYALIRDHITFEGLNSIVFALMTGGNYRKVNDNFATEAFKKMHYFSLNLDI